MFDGTFFAARIFLTGLALFFCLRFITSRWAFGAVVVIVSLVNFAHIAPLPLTNPDSVYWWQLSRGFDGNICFWLYRPALYRWYLTLFSSPDTAIAFQWIFKGGMLFFVDRIATTFRWGFGRRSFLLLALGCNSFWLQEPNNMLDTTLFTMLLTAALFFFCNAWKSQHTRWFVMFGITAGLCTLTRQVADLFLIVAIIALWLRHPRTELKKKLLCTGLFVTVGWAGAVANWHTIGLFKRTETLGINLFTHSSYYDWSVPNPEQKKLIGTLLPHATLGDTLWDPSIRSNINWVANALPHQYKHYLVDSGKCTSCSTADKQLSHEFFVWAKSHPQTYLFSIINEFKRSIFKTEEYYPSPVVTKNLPVILKRIERQWIHWPIWLMLLVPLPIIALKKNRLEMALWCGTVGYFCMMASIQLGFTRYTFPAFPFLFLLLTGTLFEMYSLAFGGRKR